MIDLQTPTAVPPRTTAGRPPTPGCAHPGDVRPSDVLDERFLARTSPRWDRASRQAGFRDLAHALAWASTATRPTRSTGPIGALADRLGVPYSVLVSVKQVRDYFGDGWSGTRASAG